MMSPSRLPLRARVTRGWILGVLAVHVALLAWGAARHSPTWDEPAHLVAGISHWQIGSFALYRVNPPLIRSVAALPVLVAGPRTDWSGYSGAPGARSEFVIHRDFIALNAQSLCWYHTLARWACIPFSLLGAWICRWWARDLYGPAAGDLAMVLWCFCPNVLANAQLITPDAGATALGAAAAYCFWRWLRAPSWSGAYPHSLSYFNELVGGPSNGHAHLLHSNIDWGQDLLYLKRWIEKHPEAQPLGLAFWNVYRPGIAGIEYLRPPLGPNALAGAPRDPDQAGPQPGWYAVSVNHLCSSRRRYDYFLHFRPVATAGYSILVYRITLEEANRVRREMNLGELSGSRAQSDGGPGDEGVY